MGHLLIESAIRGALIAAATATVLLTARIKTPATLHAIWTSVLMAMLLLPLWTVWGAKASIPVPIRPQATARVAVDPGASIVAVDAPRAVRTATTPREAPVAYADRWNWQESVLIVYGAIAGVLIGRLLIGTLTARRLVRRAARSGGMLSSAACVSPVTVGWFRPVVVLPITWRDWSRAKLDAVLTHEHEHVRRRDPLVQWFALLNRAVFWFNPVAWWLERRLAALAEQACDEAVLAKGHDPREYSEYLLDVARAVAGGARVNLAGVFMPGAFLPQRIRRILGGVPTVRVSRLRMACTAVLCAITTTLCTVATPVGAALQRAVNPSKMVVRPVRPRWVPPESTVPQPASLEWLDGDEWTFQVQSIISDEELVAYARLQNATQRDAFIDRFWARRDPTPDTPDNEFRDEYIRRATYASEHFSESGQQGFGFESDRGRVYLMFGAPDAIEIQPKAADPFEMWHYNAVPELGADFQVRFALARGLYCGYRIASPSSQPTVEGSAIGGAVGGAVVDESIRHASVQFYPHGLTAVSIPVDPARVAGAQWELRSRRGIQIDQGQLGTVDEGRSYEPLSTHLPPHWLDAGLGCTHALPADQYTLTTAVRLTSGRLYRETATFDVR